MNTFPATDTIRKSSASSAQIWAWVTFSTNVKSDMFSPFPIINWNEKLCYFNKSRQCTSSIDHTNRYIYSYSLWIKLTLWKQNTSKSIFEYDLSAVNCIITPTYIRTIALKVYIHLKEYISFHDNSYIYFLKKQSFHDNGQNKAWIKNINKQTFAKPDFAWCTTKGTSRVSSGPKTLLGRSAHVRSPSISLANRMSASAWAFRSLNMSSNCT